MAESSRFSVHPRVGHDAAQLFADDGADDQTEELETELLWVEAEFHAEELWEFDGDQDGTEEEDHGVGDGGDQHGGIAGHGEGLDEFPEVEGFRVDASEVEVFLSEVRAFMRDAAADVASFWAKEEVKDKMDTVDLES